MWKKIALIAFSLLIVVYLLFAATSLNRPDPVKDVCKQLEVNIEAGSTDGFLTIADVVKLVDNAGLNPVGIEMALVNTRAIEEMLQAQEIIAHAECYKTQTNKVHIDVKQRFPVMRILSENGSNYYIDSAGQPISSTNYACDLIVATGSINQAYARRVLAPIANLVLEDPFWDNQIVQINVLSDSTLEMVPRVGDHIVYLGEPTGIKEKLKRLRLFYKHGLNQAGWNKYERISVDIDNQIVCKKRKAKKV